MKFSQVLKSSEAAKKAWATRMKNKGTAPLDAPAHSPAKAMQLAKDHIAHAKAVAEAKKNGQSVFQLGPKVLSAVPNKEGGMTTEYAVMPKSKGFSKKADLTNAEMRAEGLGIKQARKKAVSTSGMTLKACAPKPQKAPLAMKTDAERMLGR